MTENNQIYKCSICGNIVEVVHIGVRELVCCGEPMKLQEENMVDAVVEKHVPVVERTEDGIIVKIGRESHPMTEEHFIEWVEMIADGRIYRKRLLPGDKPEVHFCTQFKELVVRAYCNVHGLWRI